MKIIDIHTHGISGVDTQEGSESSILKIAETHGKSGVYGILPTIYPASIQTMRENMAAVKKAMGTNESGAEILGINLEGPFLNPSKSGALDKNSFLKPDEKTFMELIEGFEDVIKIITVAPELKGALNLIRKISDMGIIVGMGHSDATYSEAEEGFKNGARCITHIFNAMRGIHHREPGIAGFGLINKDIYIETIGDPYHLHPKILEMIFRLKNPERIILVSDSVKESKTSEKPEGVMNEQNTLLGGAMTIKESSERLIKEGFDNDLVLMAITENPAKILALK